MSEKIEKGLPDELKETLVKMRETRLSLFTQLEKEERHIQKVVNIQASKRQEFLVICLIACFLLLASLLINPDNFDTAAGIALSIRLLLTTAAFVCLGLALFRIPGVLRCGANWNNRKEKPTYAEMIDQSNRRIANIRENLAASKQQFLALEKEFNLDEVAARVEALEKEEAAGNENVSA